MIPWVDEALKEWARDKRRIEYGNEGWPPRSVLGKLIEEGVTGAAALKFVQHHPEVLTGESLNVNRGVCKLPEDLRTVLFAHYMVRGPVKHKAFTLGISRDAYYRQLDKAHERLATHLEIEAATIAPLTVAMRGR